MRVTVPLKFFGGRSLYCVLPPSSIHLYRTCAATLPASARARIAKADVARIRLSNAPNGLASLLSQAQLIFGALHVLLELVELLLVFVGGNHAHAPALVAQDLHVALGGMVASVLQRALRAIEALARLGDALAAAHLLRVALLAPWRGYGLAGIRA